MVLPHLRSERVLDRLLARVIVDLEEVVEVEVVGHGGGVWLIAKTGVGFIFAMLGVALEVRQGSLARWEGMCLVAVAPWRVICTFDLAVRPSSVLSTI